MKNYHSGNPLEAWVKQVFVEYMGDVEPFADLLSGARGFETTNRWLQELDRPVCHPQLGTSSSDPYLLPLPFRRQEIVETAPKVEYVEKLRIEGPSPFRKAVKEMLSLIRERVPWRYREVVDNLPQAVFDPGRFKQEGWKAVARSSGYFSQAGIDTWVELLTAILHETGHNIAFENGDRSEEAADGYETMVLAELGITSTGAGSISQIVKDWERLSNGGR